MTELPPGEELGIHSERCTHTAENEDGSEGTKKTLSVHAGSKGLPCLLI